MTQLPLLALVTLLAVAAAVALLARHRPRPTLPSSPRPKETHTVTDTRTTPLPAGYDDPSSLAYVPEQLRDYFDPAPFDRLDARDAADRFDTAARADVLRRDPAVRQTLETRRGWHHDVDTRADVWLLRDVHGDTLQTLPALTPVEQARAEHLLRLARARELHDADVRERNAAEQRAANECAVCGEQRTDKGWPTHPGSTRADVVLCTDCRLTVAQLRVVELAGEQLPDGRSRADALRAWRSS